MTIPFEDPLMWSRAPFFPDDYFVYSCSSSSPPTLTLLPPCFHGGDTNPKLDNFFQPYRNQQQRIMLDQDVGILCHGDQSESRWHNSRFLRMMSLSSACCTIHLLALAFQRNGVLRRCRALLT